MAIDFAFPKKQQNYDTGVLASIRANQLAQAKMFEGETFANDGGAIGAGQAGIKRINDTSRLFERWNGTAWTEYVLGYLKNTAPVSYGSVSISGSNGGYAGVQFSDGTKRYTLMIDVTTGLSGIYSQTDAAWKWYFDGSGVLNYATVPWARLTGAPAITGLTADAAATASTVAQRNSGGHLYATYFNQSSGNNENPEVSQVMVTNGDGFLRKASIAHLGNSIVVPWGNIGSKPHLLSGAVGVWVTSSDGFGRFNFASAGRSYYKSNDGHEFRDNSDVVLALLHSNGNSSFKGRVYGNTGTSGEVGIGALTFSTSAGARAGMAAGDIHVVY